MKQERTPLPEAYLRRMERMLAGEYGAYVEQLGQPPKRGIRFNPLKCDTEKLLNLLDAQLGARLEPSPFSPLSYYLPPDAENVGYLPLHHGGAFYVQEPSAASAVTILDPKPGERILDLCAAPGGKSTQIAALTGGSGLVWSNEVVQSRAQALLSNFERMGVRNGVLSSASPKTLCRALAGFFDRVLVDAPCSGEGMFRRDGRAAAQWSEEHVQACACRQLKILESACEAVRQEGVLVYSTCTFSIEENEAVVEAFLCRHPGFVLEDSGVSFGRPAFSMPSFRHDLSLARRIFPMDGGEGHFVARLRRTESNQCRPAPADIQKSAAVQSCFEEQFNCACYGTAALWGDRGYLLPEGLPELGGLGVLRAGVLCCEQKKNRMEPAHAVFAAAMAEEARRLCSIESDAPELKAYLRGEEIACAKTGFTGVAADGVMIGFGKASGGVLKNRYPKGLRNLK